MGAVPISQHRVKIDIVNRFHPLDDEVSSRLEIIDGILAAEVSGQQNVVGKEGVIPKQSEKPFVLVSPGVLNSRVFRREGVVPTSTRLENHHIGSSAARRFLSSIGYV